MAEQDELKLDETTKTGDAVDAKAADDNAADTVADDAANVEKTDAEDGAEKDEKDGAEKDGAATDGAADGADKDADKDDYGISMDKVEAVLSKSVDEASLDPQMRKMFARQQESTKRVEESIKGTKSNPSWFVPLFCVLLVVGLIWVVIYYMTYNYPIPHIGAWNLAIGFGLMLIGFLLTMAWH